MEEVKPGVYRLSLYSMVNVYPIATRDGMMLVDTGSGWQAGRILRALKDLSVRHGPLRQMVITHGHSDHIGGAAEIRQQTGAAIWMHLADAKALSTGAGNRAVAPQGDGATTRMMGGGVRAAQVVPELADGIMLPFAPGWQVIHTPGHTPGQCCFYNQEHGVLITGDTAMNWFGRLSMPFAMATVDMAQNVESLQRVAELDVDVVLFGHGPPLREEAGERLRGLVARQTG